MSVEFPVVWRIRERMKAAGIKSARELHARIDSVSPGMIHYAQVARIVKSAPSRLPMTLLGALCVVLSCRPGDLLNPRREDLTSAKNKKEMLG